ncbi:unnamed protein product [Cunninghamella blakesleeana]
MVLAVIHSLVHSDNKQEFILLEFQGDIEFNNDKAAVTIGHHRIEGVKKKLPKPLAIIHKRDQPQNDMDIDQVEDGKQSITEYNVNVIIREKIVFSNRPKLIVKENLRGLTKIGG